MLVAIRYIGDNGAVTKKAFVEEMVKYTNSDKDNQVKSRAEVQRDLPENLIKYFRLASVNSDGLITLTGRIEGDFDFLYSGQQIYDQLKAGDDAGAFKMLQFDCLFSIPEMRSLLVFLQLKKQVSLEELRREFIGRMVFGWKFNSVTIEFEKRRAHSFYFLVHKHKNPYIYPGPLQMPTFAQILAQEYAAMTENTINKWALVSDLKEHLYNKYGIDYESFDECFKDMRLIINGLITLEAYERFIIDLDMAKRLKLYE